MKKYGYLLIGFLLLAWTACSDDNKEPGAQTPVITLDSEEGEQLLFENTGGSRNLNFSTNVAWTARADQEWCSVSPASGQAGNHSLTVTIEGNDTPNERNAAIILQAGTTTKRIVVVQKQKDALTVTSGKIEVAKAGGEIAVEVQANVAFDYEVEEAATDWIVPVQTKALETTTLRFTVKPNETEENREGKILLSSGTLSETVTVYQSGIVPEIVLTKNEYTVGSDGEEIVIELQSNIDYEMRLPDVTWITQADTRALSTYTHRLTVAPNDGYDLRTAEIHFVNEAEKIDEVVTVTQVQRDAILVAKETYEVSPAGGNLNFSVNTNVTFEVSVSADWLRQAPDTRALQEVPLSFVVDANEALEPREALITLTSDGLKQTIRVVQSGVQQAGTVVIVHTNTVFTAPTLTGPSLGTARINWGDGTEEDYAAGISHTYEDGGTQHAVSIESEGAEEISLPDLVGVSSIDLSDF